MDFGDRKIDARAGDRGFSQRAVPVVFGAADSLFGWYHAPEGPFRDCVVVLCNPLGYEAVCAYRTYRHLAERLARAGFAALRFDYHGTGDSAGDDHDARRVQAWLDSIAVALDEARSRSGASRTALFGVRMGGLLAARLAQTRDDIDSLVLWAACPSGNAYLRDLRVTGRVRAYQRDAETSASETEEVAGFILSKDAASEIAALELLPLLRRPARQALVLARASVAPSDERLAAALEARGTTTRLDAVAGYSAMMLDPHESQVPVQLLEHAVAWLAQAHPLLTTAAVAPADRIGKGSRAGTLRAHAPAGAGRRPAAVLESALRFGDGGRLFGILTMPEDGGSQRLGVVLASVGAIHRIGPGRYYVALARRLASLGVPTLRLDLSGLGDSRSPPNAEENVLYGPSAVDDLRSAMDAMAEQHGLHRFVLAGFCAGAHAAYKTASVDRRAAGLVIVNLPTFEWNFSLGDGAAASQAVKSTAFYLRALLRRDTWERLMRGEVRVGAIAPVLVERLAGLALARTRELLALFGVGSGEGEVRRVLSAMCRRGTEVMAVYSHEDPGVHEAELHLGRAARHVRDGGRLRLEVIEQSDHTFGPRRAQQRLTELLVEYLRERLLRAPAAADAAYHDSAHTWRSRAGA